MLRAIFSVIIAYIIMAGVISGAFAAAWVILGPDRVYKPGVWEVSSTWIIMMIIVGLIAAMIGGAVCAVIATRASNAAKGLAILVFVFGLLSAGYEMKKPAEEKPTVREGEITMMQATNNSQQPITLLIANPIIGVFGVLIGAGFVRKRGAAPAT